MSVDEAGTGRRSTPRGVGETLATTPDSEAVVAAQTGGSIAALPAASRTCSVHAEPSHHREA